MWHFFRTAAPVFLGVRLARPDHKSTVNLADATQRANQAIAETYDKLLVLKHIDGQRTRKQLAVVLRDALNRIKEAQLDLFGTRASAATIRVRLLKIGAAIMRNTPASSHPAGLAASALRHVYAHAVRAMAP